MVDFLKALYMKGKIGERFAGHVSGVTAFGIFAELWAFMRVRKKWWLGPIVLVLALFGALLVFSQGSALAPFVYTLF